jgi:hypothetical protein
MVIIAGIVILATVLLAMAGWGGCDVLVSVMVDNYE